MVLQGTVHVTSPPPTDGVSPVQGEVPSPEASLPAALPVITGQRSHLTSRGNLIYKVNLHRNQILKFSTFVTTMPAAQDRSWTAGLGPLGPSLDGAPPSYSPEPVKAVRGPGDRTWPGPSGGPTTPTVTQPGRSFRKWRCLERGSELGSLPQTTGISETGQETLYPFI